MALMAFREPNQVKWWGIRPAHRGTQVAKSASAINATVIIHTVTAGKTLFLCSASLSLQSGVGGGNIFVRNGADVWQFALLAAQIFTAAATSQGSSITFWPPLEIAAGWDLCTISGAAACSASGFIFGWEE